MGLIALIKDLWRSFFFVMSIQFWRMGLLWSLSVLYSHYQLLRASLFSRKLVSYPRCCPSTSPHKPVCVITGATSGLGLATACKLSKEGYVVVIVGHSEQSLSEATRKIKDLNEDAHLKAFQDHGYKLYWCICFNQAPITTTRKQPCIFQNRECNILYSPSCYSYAS